VTEIQKKAQRKKDIEKDMVKTERVEYEVSMRECSSEFNCGDCIQSERQSEQVESKLCIVMLITKLLG
jgi:hypothetical protein